MVKKEVLLFFVMSFIVLASFFISASIDISDTGSEIEKIYGLSDTIQGEINISLDNEDSDSLFITEFSGIQKDSVKLIDLLKKQSPSAIYECDVPGCQDNYQTQGTSISSKNVALSGNEIIGFTLNQKEVEIEKISFEVESNAGPSCENQIGIDFADNGEVEWENGNILNSACLANLRSSCFQSGSFDEWFAISQIPYCEKITLFAAPAFEVGYQLKAAPGTSFQNDTLRASIYNGAKEEIGNCNLPKPQEDSDGSEVKCTINYNLKKTEDHFICVSLKAGLNVEGYTLQSRIKQGAGDNVCGLFGDPAQVDEFSGDYNIKATTKKYGSVGTFIVNQTTFQQKTGDSLISLLNNYLVERYNKDCTETCIVPIRFNGLNQDVTIKNLLIRYKSNAAAGIEQTKFYTLEKSPAKISSDHISLDLSYGEFTMPTEIKDHEFRLLLNGEELISEEISLFESKPSIVKGVFPLIAATAAPTDFELIIDSSLAGTNTIYRWDFGDGTTIETNETKVKHTYNSLQSYTMKITSIKSGVQESKEFTITAISPKDAINTTLTDYKTRLDKVEAEYNSLSQNYKDILVNKEGLDVDNIRFRLTGSNGIEEQYNSLLTRANVLDSDYISLMNDLINNFDIPNSIGKSQTGSIKYQFGVSDVRVKDVGDLFDDYYLEGRETEYNNLIVAWFLENAELDVDFDTYTLFYNNRQKDFVSEFEITVKPKKDFNAPVYLIIERDKDDVKFVGNPIIVDEPGIIGIMIDPFETTTYKFSIEDSTTIFELPVYLSPQLQSLNVRPRLPPIEDTSFWGKFLFGALIVLLFFFILYILLMLWYKNKYENYLFKNKKNLYNLLFFIKNAESKKMTEKQIRSQLKKSRWSNEQITYALKKFHGERVGMWEIPIFKVFEKKKIKKEMDKRKKVAKI